MKQEQTTSKKTKLFLAVIALYFTAVAILHFARLTFGWSISVEGTFIDGEMQIHSVVSGACILFSVSVTYFIVKFLKKKDSPVKDKEVECQEEEVEEE